MHIVILGAGSIGSYLAATLAKEEHDLTVIDRDPKALEKLSRTADVAVRLGSGTDWRLLKELLEEKPHLFIALSREDETNLAACAIAKKLGYSRTAARIRSNSFLDTSVIDSSLLFHVDHLIGADIIIAHDIFKGILDPGCAAIENFAHGAVQMRTLIIPKSWEGARIKLSEVDFGGDLLVGLVKRDSSLLFPKGGDHLLQGDEVTFIGKREKMLALPRRLGLEPQTVRSVAIAGATPVSLHLAELLEKVGIAVKIIDCDETKCEALAAQLPGATLLNQDATDLDFLTSERIDLADLFVAATTSTETNILASALAKQAGCREAIALVSDASYSPLLKSLGIYYTLSERVSICNRVHAILMEGSAASVASLYDNEVQVLEMKVGEEAVIAGIPLAEVRGQLPDKFLIALIESKGKVSIPKGGSILAPGDTAIVLCSPEHAEELERTFL